MAKPDASIKVGNVQLTVWSNIITHPTKGKVTTQSITINKSYKDNKTGEWKTSTSFTYGELKHVQMAIDEALRQKYLKGASGEQVETPDDF